MKIRRHLPYQQSVIILTNRSMAERNFIVVVLVISAACVNFFAILSVNLQ
jgi:hypothetical protein